MQVTNSFAANSYLGFRLAPCSSLRYYEHVPVHCDPAIGSDELERRRLAVGERDICTYRQEKAWSEIVARVDKIATLYRHSLSGSQTMIPSSSYDAKRFMEVEAAMINWLEASNTTFEYGRERGTERAGRWASSETSGIHSTKLGPWGAS